MAVPSFLFGGETGLTQEQLAQRRRVLEAMAARGFGAPKNVGEGLTAIGNAIAYRAQMGRLEKGEAAAKERRDAIMAPLFSSTPSAPSTVDPNASASAAIPDSEVAGELAATDPAPASFSGNQQEFIESILPAAIEEGKRTGVDPRIIVAQAAQETGWGRSAPGNNLFGIKSHGQSGGNSLMTTEYVDGRPVKMRDSFRAYESPADSVRGYGDFILQNPRYEKFRTAQGLDEQLAALQASGYATDPNYSRSVGRIARGIQLPGEVASLDPSAGMPTASAAIDAVAPPSGQPLAGPAPYRDPLVSAPNYDPAAAGAPVVGGREAVANALAALPQKPQQFAPAVTTVGNALATKTGEQLPALPPAQEVGPAPSVAGAPMQQPQQVAGADYFPPAPPPPSAGLSLQQLYQISSSPDITEQDRALVNTLIQQRMRDQQLANDPLRRLQIQKAQQEIERGQPVVNLGGGVGYDPNTKEFITPPAGLKPPDFDDVSGLRKEIQQLPSYKNFAQALPIYRSMAETAGRNSKASDLNLVYGLGKIMDPTSVVREGEMVMVKNTASLPDWLQGAIASLNGGAALTPETRQAIMAEAYGRVQGYDQAFKQDTSMYGGIVERNRMNRADVIPDFGTYEPWKAPEDVSKMSVPEGVPEDVWSVMTDEEKRLWLKK
ncbi:glucosaminidase domain-containing protein [Neorhizobium petrolearium]|uniref:glycoside hydrolase family 73 protein n=1 Tax=Neorhizobium petrolearium TaxID=515361 RepID=UPI003F14E242